MPSRMSKKRRFKRIIYSKPVLIGLLVLAVFSVRAAWGAYARLSEITPELRRARDLRADLRVEKVELEEELARLETRAGREEELRERYGAAKPGERMVVIVDPEPKEDSATEPETGFWEGWWQKLTGVFR